MKNLKEIIKIGVILFAITAVSALLLAVVNKVTAPKILKNQTEKTYASMSEILPVAYDFEVIDVKESSNIKEAYKALDSSGLDVGYCIISTAFGYGGELSVLTAISENKVVGIEILSHSETPGLGAKAIEPEFKDNFSEKTSGIKVVKKNAKENEINAMSGATITSTAVTDCVNAALEFASEVEKNEK